MEMIWYLVVAGPALLILFLWMVFRGETVGSVGCRMAQEDPASRMRLSVVRHRPDPADPYHIEVRARAALSITIQPMDREDAISLADCLEDAARRIRR